LRAWRDHPTQLVEKIAGWSIIVRKSLQPDLKRPIDRLPQAHRLPPNHASQSHQQDGQRDMDPLLHGGSMACLPAEIEKTRAMVAYSTSGAGARELQREKYLPFPC
jgi:hypothetical protein